MRDGGFSSLPSTTVEDNLEVRDLSSSATQNEVCGAEIAHNLNYRDSGAPVEIGASSGCPGNTVGGNLDVQGNSASTVLFGNSVKGDLHDDDNVAPTQVTSNTVDGDLKIERNSASVQILNNTVKKTLVCWDNSSITGAGNSARQKEGQCTNF